MNPILWFSVYFELEEGFEKKRSETQTWTSFYKYSNRLSELYGIAEKINWFSRFSHGEHPVNFVLAKLLQTLCHFWNFWSAWCCEYVGAIWSTRNILQNFHLFQYVFKPKLLRDILLHSKIPKHVVRRFFDITDLKFVVAAFLLASLNFQSWKLITRIKTQIHVRSKVMKQWKTTESWKNCKDIEEARGIAVLGIAIKNMLCQIISFPFPCVS